MGDDHDGKLELTERAEVHEHVGDEHRHGPVGEVDDARAAVLEHEALAENRVSRAGAEAEDHKQDVAGHGRWRWLW